MQPPNPLLELPSLEQVLDRFPVTVPPETPTIDAIQLMHHEQSHYVLVTQSAQLVGILTEQDVVRLVARESLGSGTIVADVMTRDVIALSWLEAQDVLKILTTLQQHRIRQLPIVDEQNQLVGVVTNTQLQQFMQPMNTVVQLQTEAALQQQIEQERLIAEIAQRIHRSLNLHEILQTTVDRVREFLHCDRVIMFRFSPDWSGIVVVESVDSRWTPILSTKITDPCFQQSYVVPYHQGQISANPDIYQLNVDRCYVNLLARFQVRANLVVPILQESYEVSAQASPESTRHLWGLLIAHQCAAPRHWQPLEITLLQQLATQVGIAIQQSELYQQAQAELAERRRAEEALRQNNDRLTLALEAAKMGSWDWNLHTNETIWTPYQESILGYTPGNPIRTYQTWRDRVHPEDLPRVETAIETARRDRQDYECEYRIVRTDGSLRWVSSLGRFVYNAHGEAIRMVGMMRDITEKKQLEAQFLRTQRLESLGTLASGIAHDLNNVLTPILAASQYLQLRFPNLDDRNQQMLKMLEVNARRGADLVKQVLSFARGVDGRRVPLQVGHLLSEIEQVIKRTFPKSIDVHIDMPASLWTVSADATQLHQVIMNLCVNARDAMPQGGTLSIAAENRLIDETFARLHVDARVGAHVVITVADGGSGIAADVIDRIFDPFFTTKEVGKGTGLGLATVMGIVKSHEGFVCVSSEVGAGTRFQVYLPASNGVVDSTSETLNYPIGNHQLILIVDDETAVQEVTKTVLESYDYRVMVASDGKEAIAKYANHHTEISLVLMDVMMPSMDGLTAIRALQHLNPHVKIIATSGLATVNHLHEIERTGITAFLAKPYTTQDLLGAIAQSLTPNP